MSYLEQIYKKKPTFMRYGGLSPVKQKRGDSYHSAPAKKGIYAFVLPLTELFLVSSMTYSRDKYSAIRDKNGNYIDCIYIGDEITYEHVDYENYRNKNKYIEHHLNRNIWDSFWDLDEWCDDNDIPILSSIKPIQYFRILKRDSPRKFQHSGLIWSHLDSLKTTAVLGKSGSWILTDMPDYCDMLIQALKNHRKDQIRISGSLECQPIASCVSLDHFEVFIERIK